MPHSLRAKLSGLRYKGILEDKDYKRLCHALDLEKAEQEPTDTWSIKDVADTFKKHGLIREQEPCDDVVSRQAVLEIAKQHTLTNDYLAIQNLPPVRPQEQTGHWIRQDNTKEPLYGWYFCSECNSVIGDKTKFCSNCGCRMVEPQESEEV